MPYEITRRQTTFWEFRHDRGLDRIHFLGKTEFRFVEAGAESYAVVAEHAVLVDYACSWEELYINAPVLAPDRVLAAIAAAVYDHLNSWRSAERYLNAGGATHVLDQGFGLLLAGPEPIAELSKSVLRSAGAQFSTLPGRTPSRPLQALIAGRNFVVARAFRIERVT